MQPFNSNNPNYFLSCLVGGLCFFFSMNLFAQVFEITPGYSYLVPERSKVSGMNNTHLPSLKFTYFPSKKVPIGVFISGGITRYASYRNKTNNVEPFVDTWIDTTVYLYNNFGTYFIGIKLANQYSRKIINPFFNASFGFGQKSTRMKLYSDTPSSKEDEMYDTEHISGGRLFMHRGGLYLLEGGIEITPIRREDLAEGYCITRRFSVFISSGIMGSFQPFKYHNVRKSTSSAAKNDHPTVNYTEMKGGDLENNPTFNERLLIWQFSGGIIIRF